MSGVNELPESGLELSNIDLSGLYCIYPADFLYFLCPSNVDGMHSFQRSRNRSKISGVHACGRASTVHCSRALERG